MRQLSAQDASFLYLESQGAHLHLTALYIYDPSSAPAGKVSYGDILRHVGSRLHISPVFRQKVLKLPLNVDFPYWVDDHEFDLESHFRRITLPAPSDWRELCTLVARIHSLPLDLSRPPWEMHVVEGLDSVEGIPEGAFAIVARYHHAAVDGATGTVILSRLHDTSNVVCASPESTPWAPEVAPDTIGLMTRAAANNARTPFRLAKAVAASVPALGRRLLQSEQTDIGRPARVPMTRFNKPVSPRRVFDGLTFELEELGPIRAAVAGATINDVVLAICGGTLREYLTSKDELPAESLIAMAPINIRTPDRQGIAGTMISMMFVPIHTEIADPIERLRAIRDATRSEKELKNALSARQMTDIATHIPASTQALAGRLITGLGLGHRAIRMCNCTITNVPGPQKPLYLKGAKLLRATGCGPVIDGMGLIIGAMSYNGQISFSFTSCREIMPEPGFFSECALGSFRALKTGAGTGSRLKAHGRQEFNEENNTPTG